MNDYFEMILRKTGEPVRVYGLSVKNSKTLAIIYRPIIASLGKNPAKGWLTVDMTALVPPDFWINNSSRSKTNG